MNDQEVAHEKQMIVKSKEMTKEAQKSNFASLLAKQAVIMSKGAKKRLDGTKPQPENGIRLEDDGQIYYASVKLPDTVSPKDPRVVRKSKADVTKSGLQA